jgi:hypothetical protein
MDANTSGSRFERMREKKRLQELHYRSNVSRNFSHDTEESTQDRKNVSNPAGNSHGSRGRISPPSHLRNNLGIADIPSSAQQSRDNSFDEASAKSASIPDPLTTGRGEQQERMNPPVEGVPGKEKSIMHSIMFDATDAWIQSYTSSGSGSDKSDSSGRPKHSLEAVPGVEQVLSAESSFEATFEDKDEEDYGYYKHPRSPLVGRKGHTEHMQPMEPEEVVSVEPESVVHGIEQEEVVESTQVDPPHSSQALDDPPHASGDPPQASDDPPAETNRSFDNDSIVSMESTEEHLDMTESLDSNISMASTEDRGGWLSTNTSFDSIESMQSDMPPLPPQRFQIEQKPDLQASWATLKSPSSSSSSASSMEDLADIFVRDANYSWLPAKVFEYCNDYALVAIDTQDTWKESTVMEKGDTLSPGHLHSSMKSIPKDDVYRLTSEFGVPSFQLRKVLFKDYEQGDLPLQNKQGEEKRDMADLMELNSAAILYNLKNRHYLQKPYTRVGDIVIAMNPFTWINELYEPDTRDMYSKNLIWEGKAFYCQPSHSIPFHFSNPCFSLPCISAPRDGS